MSDVTEADRHIAGLVVGVWKHTGDDLVEILAMQLAAEREKARARFLALADELSREAGAYETSDKFWTIRIADRIRRAAEEG